MVNIRTFRGATIGIRTRDLILRLHPNLFRHVYRD